MALALSRFAVLISMLLAACGGNVVVDDRGAGGASCDELPVPVSFKGCVTRGDCTIVFTSVDCCDTALAAGVNGSALTALDVFEGQCNPQQPICGCDPGPSRTDDGSSTAAIDSIHVACEGGLCLTFVE